MKKTLLLCCVLGSLTRQVVAVDTAIGQEVAGSQVAVPQVMSPETVQQAESASNENKINPEIKRALDLVSFTMNMFVLANCAAIEKYEYTRGYCTCLIDVKINELRTINTSFAQSLLCHLYVWFEKTERIMQEAYNSGQKKIKIPELDLSSGKDTEVDLDEQIKRIQSEEDAMRSDRLCAARFFPFR